MCATYRRRVLVLGLICGFAAGCSHAPRGEGGAVVVAPQSPAGAQVDPEPLGSLRHARVAYADAKGTTLTFLAGDMPGEELAALRAASPNLRILEGLTREGAMVHAGEAHGADARFVTPASLRRRRTWCGSRR